MTNLFREAQQLLREKHPLELSKGEKETVISAAEIPLTLLARYNDMTTEEGLEDLARIVDENKDAEADQTPAPFKEVAIAEEPGSVIIALLGGMVNG